MFQSRGCIFHKFSSSYPTYTPSRDPFCGTSSTRDSLQLFLPIPHPLLPTSRLPCSSRLLMSTVFIPVHFGRQEYTSQTRHVLVVCVSTRPLYPLVDTSSEFTLRLLKTSSFGHRQDVPFILRRHPFPETFSVRPFSRFSGF